MIGRLHALKEGRQILIAHRRLFEHDEVRFFLGEIDEYEVGIVKVRGHSFVHDKTSGSFIKKTDTQVKILSLSSGTLLVYQLPEPVLSMRCDFETANLHVSLTDGKEFTMNLTEHTHGGRL